MYLDVFIEMECVFITSETKTGKTVSYDTDVKDIGEKTSAYNLNFKELWGV